MAAQSIGSVERIDYADGVYVTIERLEQHEERSEDERYYFVLWTPEAGSTDSGYEVEDCGYAVTKREALELARKARQDRKTRLGK